MLSLLYILYKIFFSFIFYESYKEKICYIDDVELRLNLEFFLSFFLRFDSLENLNYFRNMQVSVVKDGNNDYARAGWNSNPGLKANM